MSTHTYALGPADARLTVRTSRSGAAAKAGHDLLIEASAWCGTLELDAGAGGGSVVVKVDPASLRVLEGTGGITALGDDDKAKIVRTITEQVLKDTPIEYRSSELRAAGEVCHVQGELTLNGRAMPLAFDLRVTADGHLSAGVVVKQSTWGVKPYSGLLGALKVDDDLLIEVEGRLPRA